MDQFCGLYLTEYDVMYFSVYVHSRVNEEKTAEHCSREVYFNVQDKQTKHNHTIN